MTSDVYFVYDGECPLCRMGAKYIRIRKAAGNLQLIDARTQADHSVMQAIRARGLSVDDGMVLMMKDVCYHAADALHALALMGSDNDWANRLNAKLFSSKRLSRISYPFMKAGRRIALWCKGVPPL